MDIFLTEGRKKKYMSDFKNNVLNCKDEFWGLDQGLENLLQSINENKLVQSLYSKKHYDGKEDSSGESYLKFCFHKDVELKIFREILPAALITFNRVEDYGECSKCFYMYDRARGIKPNGNSKIELGCLNEGDFFSINSIQIYLQTEKLELHVQFWSFLERELTKLTLD